MNQSEKDELAILGLKLCQNLKKNCEQDENYKLQENGKLKESEKMEMERHEKLIKKQTVCKRLQKFCWGVAIAFKPLLFPVSKLFFERIIFYPQTKQIKVIIEKFNTIT